MTQFTMRYAARTKALLYPCPAGQQQLQPMFAFTTSLKNNAGTLKKVSRDFSDQQQVKNNLLSPRPVLLSRADVLSDAGTTKRKQSPEEGASREASSGKHASS